MFAHFFSLHGNHDGHLAGLMEAKLEEIGKICPNRKDVPFTFYNFVFMHIFCRCNRLGAMNFLKNNVCSLIFSPRKSRRTPFGPYRG